ncbi:MoaD/ThiS family protein [Desulfopila sp. IMCC35008]|uniref:MoaD/ThiS family protein n=1 Tax=Desulfopila sp. IMCC35008 TaxID=2653858 RepID=UPI0013D5A491|nr:MoaD/ThiS family protein [Desulfopila sp. IMCC35008]
MVTFHFKLSELGTVTLDIDQPEQLDSLVRRCAAGSDNDSGGYIAVRNGRVIQGDCLIEDEDTITILPAISGG